MTYIHVQILWWLLYCVSLDVTVLSVIIVLISI